MLRASILVLLLALVMAVPALGQEHEKHEGKQQEEQHEKHGGPPHANEGRIPPPPEARRDSHGEREGERFEGGRVNNRPHVNNDHWYGHDRADDPRYRVTHPFEHGRFEHFGPSFRYVVIRVDRHHHRFWFPGGYYFEIASWDWPECEGWCWNCGDDFVIYEDPDHIGWYLLYDIETGAYVHVIYLGA